MTKQTLCQLNPLMCRTGPISLFPPMSNLCLGKPIFLRSACYLRHNLMPELLHLSGHAASQATRAEAHAASSYYSFAGHSSEHLKNCSRDSGNRAKSQVGAFMLGLQGTKSGLPLTCDQWTQPNWFPLSLQMNHFGLKLWPSSSQVEWP